MRKILLLSSLAMVGALHAAELVPSREPVAPAVTTTSTSVAQLGDLLGRMAAHIEGIELTPHYQTEEGRQLLDTLLKNWSQLQEAIKQSERSSAKGTFDAADVFLSGYFNRFYVAPCSESSLRTSIFQPTGIFGVALDGKKGPDRKREFQHTADLIRAIGDIYKQDKEAAIWLANMVLRSEIKFQSNNLGSGFHSFTRSHFPMKAEDIVKGEDYISKTDPWKAAKTKHLKEKGIEDPFLGTYFATPERFLRMFLVSQFLRANQVNDPDFVDAIAGNIKMMAENTGPHRYSGATPVSDLSNAYEMCMLAARLSVRIPIVGDTLEVLEAAFNKQKASPTSEATASPQTPTLIEAFEARMLAQAEQMSSVMAIEETPTSSALAITDRPAAAAALEADFLGLDTTSFARFQESWENFSQRVEASQNPVLRALFSHMNTAVEDMTKKSFEALQKGQASNSLGSA